MNRVYSKFLKVVSDINKLTNYTKNDIRKFHIVSRSNNASRESSVLSSFPQTSKLPPKVEKRKRQHFNYFLVLDFEATCDAPVNVIPQEIIEFPVLKVSGKTFLTEATFHSYVKPKVNSELTSFCTELTGIVQDMVDDQPYFEDVYMNFNNWMQVEGLFKPDVKFAFVTCGDWDLKYLLQVQCKGLHLPIPDFMKTWINIKTSFSEIAQTFPRNLNTMIKICGLEHEGRLHSGIDDCKNIANILRDLADRGILFEHNSQCN